MKQNIDIDNHWGWFVDIENDINKNNIKQIIRISNNCKGGLPTISETDEVSEKEENNQFEAYFNIKSITTTTLFVLSMIYMLY